MSVIQVTDLQAMRLELLRLVQNDPAAYKVASDFVGDQAISSRFSKTVICKLTLSQLL